MPAPQRSKPLKPAEFSFKAKDLPKPTLFRDSVKPSSIPPYIRHISWSPTGTLLSSTTGSAIRIWNPENPSLNSSHELKGHSGAVEKVVWNPTRECEVASTGSDGTVRIWDARSKGPASQEIKIGDGGLFLAWSPDGRELVAGRRDDVIVPIDVRRGVMGEVEGLETREGRKLQSAQTNQMCFSNSGRQVFATTGDGAVRVMEWPSLRTLHMLSAHTSAAFSVQMSPNGSHLAVGGGDSLISLWDTHDWACRNTLANSTGAIHHLSFSFDGTYLCGGCGPDKDTQSGLDIYHVETGETAWTIDTTNPVNVVAWHPLRYWLAYAGDTGGLKVFGLGSAL